MDAILDGQPQALAVSLVDLVISLSLCFLIGLWMVYVYRVTHRGLTYERSFLVSLVMISPIVAVVMMLIGSNLALSLGMVGALSIIRFRTVIKDSRDMVYLFWAIAVGLGGGTFNWSVTAVASAFLSLVLLLLYYLNYGRQNSTDYILVVGGKERSIDQAILELLQQVGITANVRSLEVREHGWEMVLEVRFRDDRPRAGSHLLDKLRELPGVSQASLLAPHLSLPT